MGLLHSLYDEDNDECITQIRQKDPEEACERFCDVALVVDEEGGKEGRKEGRF